MKKKLLFGILLCFCGQLSAQLTNDTLFSDTTFLAANNPHIFNLTRFVAMPNVKVSVDSGVVMEFIGGGGFQIGSGGSLRVSGTVTDSVYWTGGFISAGPSSTGGPTQANVNFSYVHMVGMGGFDNISSASIDHCWMQGCSGVTYFLNPFFTGSTPSISISNSVSYDGGTMIGGCHGSITNCQFYRTPGPGPSVVNTTIFSSFGSGGSFCTSSIGDSYFEGYDVVIDGGLEELCVFNCEFRNNRVAINTNSVISFELYNSRFLENDSAIINMGNRVLTYVAGSEFSDNLQAISVTGNFNGVGPIMSPSSFNNGFLDNTFYNNTVNARIGTSLPVDLENNCWGEADSAGVKNTFLISPGITDNTQIVPFSIDCVPDQVFPGDTDHDQLCDITDLFPIGIHFGKTGPVRMNASTNWVGQIAQNWGDTLANGRDIKHVDTDGNGTIDAGDSLAVVLNYGKTHDNLRIGRIGGAGDTPFYWDALPPTVQQGDTILLNLNLGKADSLAEDIYGIAFRYGFDEELIASANLSFGTSWLGQTGTNLLALPLSDSLGTLAAMVRTDQVNQTGHGPIAQLELILKNDLPDTIEIQLDLNAIEMIQVDGSVVPVNSTSTTQEVIVGGTLSVPGLPQAAIRLYPNPTAGVVLLESPQHRLQSVRLLDLQGRTILTESVEGFTWKRNLGSLAKGIYWLSVETEAGNWYGKVVLQ